MTQKQINNKLFKISIKYLFNLHEYAHSKNDELLLDMVKEFIEYWRSLDRVRIKNYTYYNKLFKIRIKITDYTGSDKNIDDGGFDSFDNVFKFYVNGIKIKKQVISDIV